MLKAETPRLQHCVSQVSQVSDKPVYVLSLSCLGCVLTLALQLSV